MVREAFQNRTSIPQAELEIENGRRIEIALEIIQDERQSLGALLTLHDLESVREIESELELSRRLSAIGRLTGGVGHEVKNPINAIVVHLELMRNKLASPEGVPEPPAMRHLDIIQSEIQRLDRVVQTLIDFSRPVELKLEDEDLRSITSGVLTLASAEFESQDIQLETVIPDNAGDREGGCGYAAAGSAQHRSEWRRRPCSTAVPCASCSPRKPGMRY